MYGRLLTSLGRSVPVLLVQNIRRGARRLRHDPAFALTAILTLGLGIGLSTAVFTVADALLVRRLPVQDQNRIVVLTGERADGRAGDAPLGYTDAREFTSRTRSLTPTAFFGYEGAVENPVRDGARIVRLRRALVSGDFFAVLGSRATLGRALRSADDAHGAAPVLVLSHRAWEQLFGGDPTVIGRQVVTLYGGVSYTVVGVMPEGLEYPRGTDAWATIFPAMPESALPFLRYEVIGRLAPGSTSTLAAGELTAFFHRPDGPATQRSVRGTVHTLTQLILGDTRPAVLVFAAAAALLLLITCINVGNLLLVSGLARAREVAVRSALGARRGQVLSQLLTEHALLAVIGGALGFVVAMLGIRAFVAFAPAGLPRLDEIHVNGTALGGALAITVVALLLFGIVPAVLTSRTESQEVLRSGTRQSASRRSRTVTEALVVGQLALAVLVLSAAALIARSLIKLETVDLAFEPSHLLIGELVFRQDEYDTAPKQLALLQRLLPEIQAIPGVRAISPVVAAPFSGSAGWDGSVAAEGQSAADAATNPRLNMEVVTPRYFATLGIPMLRGRDFTDYDRADAPPVVILSQSAAQYYWPGADPVRKRLTMGPASAQQTLTVVGVVPNTRYRDLRDARASIYFPLKQSLFPFAPTTLAIRTTGPPDEVVPAIRRAISQTAPGVTLLGATPFETLLQEPLAQPRLDAFVLAVFAVTAVVLAAVGLFGVIATMVQQRTHELGVRMALGATAVDIGRLVLGRGMTLAVIGTAAGLLGAVAINRLLAAMLFEVSPTDPATLSVVALLLLVVAALASIIPARASTRIDPAVALRAE